MAVKIKDIAKALSISPATVSMVFNNKPGVGSETRDRVLEYANKIGYQPSRARQTHVKSTGSIRFIVYKKTGLIVTDTPFFSALIESIYVEARREHYNLVISYIDSRKDKSDLMKFIKDDPLDGIIILATEMDSDDIKVFGSASVPVVVLDSYFEMEKFDTVVINNVRGAFEATKYLIDCGHTKIGHLKSSVPINNFYEREVGFKKALRHAVIEYDGNYDFFLSPSIDGSYSDMLTELKNGRDLPTAFFADNDIIAFGAMKAMKECGVVLPDDVSIVGFDDIPYSTLIEPHLTTINVYKKRIGILAVKRIMERICGAANELVKIEVGGDLIIRESVAQRR